MLDLANLTETEKAMQRDTSAMINGLRLSLTEYIDAEIAKIRAELGLGEATLYPANWSGDVTEYIKNKEGKEGNQ